MKIYSGRPTFTYSSRIIQRLEEEPGVSSGIHRGTHTIAYDQVGFVEQDSTSYR